MNHAGQPTVPSQGAIIGAVLRNTERHMGRSLRTDPQKIHPTKKIPLAKVLGVLSPFFQEGAKRGLGQRPKVFLLFINLLVLSRRHAEFFFGKPE